MTSPSLLLRLVYDQLRLGQLIGFVLAHIVGLGILLMGYQFYQDAREVLSSQGGLVDGNQIILSKRVSALTTMSGRSNTFTSRDIERLGKQPFAREVGEFTPARYRVSAGVRMGVEVYTYMFFEAVPDKFIDVRPGLWHYDESERTIPIIIPRSYLTLYNAAFSQTQGLPLLSEGVLEDVPLSITLSGNGLSEEYRGRIVGFSDRLNTLLVPLEFMRWANERYAPGVDLSPSRLVLHVDNPQDEALLGFIKRMGYQVEGASLEAGQSLYLVRVIAGAVGVVGLVISALSLYLMLLSLYLVVERNTTALRQLLLLGYTRAQLSRPYQAIVVALSFVALAIALGGVYCARGIYLPMLGQVFALDVSWSMLPTIMVGIALVLILLSLALVAIWLRIGKLPAYPDSRGRS